MKRALIVQRGQGEGRVGDQRISYEMPLGIALSILAEDGYRPGLYHDLKRFFRAASPREDPHILIQKWMERIRGEAPDPLVRLMVPLQLDVVKSAQ